MGYAELELKIRQEFEAELESIKSEYASQVATIEAQSMEDVEKRRQIILSNGRRNAESKYQRIVNDSRNQAARIISAERSKSVDEVFALALKRIPELSDERKSKFLKLLINDAQSIPGPKTLRVTAECAKYIGQTSGIKVIVEDIGDFGLIIESEDGMMRIDNRLSQIMEVRKHSIKKMVNEILFR